MVNLMLLRPYTSSLMVRPPVPTRSTWVRFLRGVQMKTRIPIKKYVMDEALSWEERYKKLEFHHEEETKFLIGKIEELEKLIKD